MRRITLEKLSAQANSPAVLSGLVAVLAVLVVLVVLLVLLVLLVQLGRAATLTISMWSAVSLGNDNEGGLVGTFPDSATAASTGFASIPTARALAMAPRWLSRPALPTVVALPEHRLALAVVGLPVDVGHVMLHDVNVSSYCIAPEDSGKAIASLCVDPKQLYEKYSNLCDFDSDCWHSTAVAILAAGGKIEANSIAYRNLKHTAEF